MASTYVPLATTTLGSATSNVTFSSISGSYTDLVLIISGLVATNGDGIFVQFNGDTGTNYSFTYLSGSGSTAASGRQTAKAFGAFNFNTGWSSTEQNNGIMHILNYANASTYKTTLARSNNPNGSSYPGTEATVSLWRSTSAINSIKIYTGNANNLASGFTATLYGILAA